MKRLSFKIVFIALSMILISGCSAKSVKSDPENFQFKVNDTWRIERWYDTHGSLKITEKLDSNSYLGELTVTYVNHDKRIERIETVIEVLEITINKKSIKMTGKKVTGSATWSLDNFSFDILTSDLLKGHSKDGRGSGGKIILSRGKDSEVIKAKDIRGKWNLAEKTLNVIRQKAAIKKLKLDIDNDNLKVKTQLSDDKMVVDITYYCSWKIKKSFVEVVFTDFDVDADLNYEGSEIQKMDATSVQLMRDMIKAKKSALKEDVKSKIFSSLMNKPMFFKLIKINADQIEIRKEKDIFRIRR